jgi:hypothetical protein
MRNISDKLIGENQNTFSVQYLFFQSLSINEIMWKNVVEPDDNTVRYMRFACWITKATDTHSDYVIFIAFPRQQWLLERASMLRL